MAISSLGIGSGILTSQLVDDLVKAERDSTDKRLDLQKTELEAEISAFGQLKSALDTLKGTTDSLKLASSLESISAKSSDETLLTATASSVAQAGDYAVKVNKTAQSHSLVSKSYNAITDVVGTGELTFRFGTTTFSGDNYDDFSLDTSKSSKTLTIDSSNNTLSGLRDAINSAKFGVQASIVNDGDGFRLLLSSEETGETNSLEILVAGDGNSGLKQFAFNSTYNGTDAVGAITEGGSVDLSAAGIDFASSNATFTFNVGAFSDIAVTVNENATTDLGGGADGKENNRIAVQNAINTALAAKGLAAGSVIASIDPDDGGLILTTQGTGSDESIEITADNGGLGLNPNLGPRYGSDGSLTQTQAARSAEIEINGLTIKRDSNLVTEAIGGVTLNLKNADAGKTVNLTLESDTAGITEKVKSFVDAYNEFKKLSNELTAYNAAKKEGGLLLGDSTLRAINTQTRALMNGVVSGITGSKFRSLSEVGISTNKDNGYLLELNSVELKKAIEENPKDIVSLFATNTSSSDPLIEVVNTGTNTKPGSYKVELTQVATQGDYKGAANASFDSNIVIDDDNNNFKIKVNGVTSGEISLTQKTYATGADLAAELQLRINNDAELLKGNDTITVSYNATAHRFEFESGEYGSKSSISFVEADDDLAVDTGIGVSVGTTTAGLDVKGTINGEAATGTGQYLRASDGALSAKPGFVRGATLSNLNVPLTVSQVDINNDNYAFKVNVDGIASDKITIAAGTYATAEDLATAMQTAINNDAKLKAADKTVTVDFDLGLSVYGIISGSTGKASSVNFTEVATNIGTQFGFAVGGGTQGKDASGSASDAAGLRVRVLGGSLGARGSASYIQGAAHKLSALYEDILGNKGLIDTKNEALQDLLDGVADKKVAHDTRIEQFQASLTKKFASADGVISQLKTTENYLSEQFKILSAALTNKN